MEERKPPEGERIRGLDVPITRKEWDKGGGEKEGMQRGALAQGVEFNPSRTSFLLNLLL